MSILMTRTTAGNIMIKKSQSVYASHQQQAKALNLDVMWCTEMMWFLLFFIVSQSLTSNHGVCVLKLMCSACVLACMRACAYKIENWATRRDTVNDMHGANIYFEIKVKSLLNMELFLSFVQSLPARFSSFNSHFHIRVLFELPESSYPKCIFWWLVFSTIHNK